MTARSLPLGVDIGATRLRVIDAREDASGVHVHAAAVRDIAAGAASSGAIADAEYVSAVLEDALAELGSRERRCVTALGEPDAFLRTVRFPKMSSLERERSARFEAQRHAEFPLDEAVVRIHPLAGGVWLLGIARTAAVTTRVAALRGAGLRPVAIDHELCAYGRALPDYDAIVDIGYSRASLHVPAPDAPATMQTFSGGADITRAIERELAIDQRSAEKRKRILGTAGAGERARAALLADIASLVMQGRQTHSIARIALAGNGARLPGIAKDLERATGALCETAFGSAVNGGGYPADVLRSSAPDWALATGLALWGRS